MMETKTASCCSSIAVPLSKLLPSLAHHRGRAGRRDFDSDTIRPLPVQHARRRRCHPAPAAPRLRARIRARFARDVPSVALLGLVGLGLIVTVLLHVRSAARALDARPTCLRSRRPRSPRSVRRISAATTGPTSSRAAAGTRPRLRARTNTSTGATAPSGHASFSAVAAAVVTLYALQVLEGGRRAAAATRCGRARSRSPCPPPSPRLRRRGSTTMCITRRTLRAALPRRHVRRAGLRGRRAAPLRGRRRCSRSAPR